MANQGRLSTFRGLLGVSAISVCVVQTWLAEVAISAECSGRPARLAATVKRPAPSSEGDQRLFDAIEQNDHAKVRRLLQSGVDVNKLGGRAKETPLMWALTFGDYELVRILLDARPDVNIQDELGRSAMLGAVEFKDKGKRAAIVRSLIAAGADPNARTEFAAVFTHALATTSPLPVFRELLAGGLRTDAPDRSHATPLCDAATYARADVVRLLLDGGAKVNAPWPNGNTALMCAADSADHDERGCVRSVRLLLAAGADVHATDEDGRTALHYAAKSVYKNVAPGVFRKLIKAGAKVDARDKDGMTPLMVAAQQSPRYEMVEALVSAGADVKARDQSGNCVLTYAVVAAQYPKDAASAAYLLLHEGADPNVADTDGWTPLMCAARAYNTGVLRVLLNAEEINPQAKPAAVDARTRHGWTALMIAIGSTDPKVILRGFGAKPAGPAKRADANKKPEDKATAEFLERSEALGAAYAADWACHGQLERVWVLLTHGADPNTRANDGTSIDTLLEGRTDLEGLAIRKLIDLMRSEKASGQKRPKNPMENVH